MCLVDSADARWVIEFVIRVEVDYTALIDLHHIAKSAEIDAHGASLCWVEVCCYCWQPRHSDCYCVN